MRLEFFECALHPKVPPLGGKACAKDRYLEVGRMQEMIAGPRAMAGGRHLARRAIRSQIRARRCAPVELLVFGRQQICAASWMRTRLHRKNLSAFRGTRLDAALRRDDASWRL